MDTYSVWSPNCNEDSMEISASSPREAAEIFGRCKIEPDAEAEIVCVSGENGLLQRFAVTGEVDIKWSVQLLAGQEDTLREGMCENVLVKEMAENGLRFNKKRKEMEQSMRQGGRSARKFRP